MPVAVATYGGIEFYGSVSATTGLGALPHFNRTGVEASTAFVIYNEMRSAARCLAEGAQTGGLVRVRLLRCGDNEQLEREGREFVYERIIYHVDASLYKSDYWIEVYLGRRMVHQIAHVVERASDRE